MIIGDTKYMNVNGFTNREIQSMRDYLLGAAQVWCRDRHGEWFAARDLLGGRNFRWEGTPLYPLFAYYRRLGDYKYAITQAGRAAGWLLKRVLIEDRKRNYETRRRRTREYRWVGQERLIDTQF